MATTTIGSFLVRLLFDGSEFDEGTETAEKRLDGFGASLSKAGAMLDGAIVAGLKAAGAAMAGFAAVTIKTGADFEQAITTVGAVSGATVDDLSALTDQARKLGSATAFSATEAATGMQDLARAGLSTPEIIAASESALLLAGASASSMSEATSILASTFAQFQIPASEAARVSDVFATAMNNSQLSMESLREGMKFAGVTGQQFGMTLEQTTAALAQFRNLGLEGSMAGNAFKMAMLSATQQTDEKREALDALGLTFDQINPEIHSFGEIMQTVGDAGISATQASVIFGARAGVAVAGVAEQFANGSSTFDDLVGKLNGAAGSTAETYDRMTATVSGQTAIVRSAFEELALTTFDTFGGGLSDLLGEIASTIAFVAADFSRTSGDLAAAFDTSIRDAIEYLKANRENIAATFRAFAEATGEVVILLGRIAPLLDEIGSLLVAVFVANKVRAFVAALVSMVGALSGTVTAVGGVRLALKLLYAELVAMSGGTLALVAAIGVLVVALVSLIGSSDDAADAADRLREAQSAQEKVESAQHEARLARASELQGATQSTSLALAARLAEEDRLSDALESRLTAVSKLTAEEIESGLQQGSLIEATIEGERVVLDYAAALELAKLGGEEQSAANHAMAGAFVATGERIVEAEAALAALTAEQDRYNANLADGISEHGAFSVSIGRIAPSMESFRVQLAAATSAVEDAKAAQTELARTAERLGRAEQIEAARKAKRAAKEREQNRERADGAAELTEAFRKASEARARFEEGLASESVKISGDLSKQVVAALADRLRAAEQVFDAEVEAARKAGAEVTEIEERRRAAVEQIRTMELAAVAEGTREKVEEIRRGLYSEQQTLAAVQRERRDALLAGFRAEIALAESAGRDTTEIQRRKVEAVRLLSAAEHRENTEAAARRIALVEQTEREILDLIGASSAEVAALEARRDSALFASTRRRLEAEIEFARRREEAERKTSDFLVANDDLTAEQRIRIEEALAAKIAAIDEEEIAARGARLREFLGQAGAAAAAAVAAAGRAAVEAVEIGRRAASALSGIFSSFTGGLSLSSLSGAVDEIAGEVEDAGGKLDVSGAARSFVDGLVENASRFLSTLIEAAPILVREIGEALPGLIADVADALPAVMQSVAESIGPVIEALVEGIPLLVQGIADALPALVETLVDLLGTAIPALLEDLGPIVSNLVEQLIEALPEIVDAAAAALSSLIDTIAGLLTQVVAALPEIVRALVASLPQILTSLLDGVGEIVAALIEAIPGILVAVLDGLPAIIGALVDGLLGAVVSIIEALPALISGLLTDVIPTLIESLILVVAQLIESVLAALPQIIYGIVALLPVLVSSIVEMIPNVLVAIVSSLPTLIESLVTGVLSAIPQIVIGLVAAIPSIIVALLDSLFTELLPRLPLLAVELVVALVRGIVEGIKGFVDVFRTIFKEALGFVGDLFGEDEEGDGLLKRIGEAITGAFDSITASFNDTPGVVSVGASPMTAMFAPRDLVVAAKDPLDLARMALSAVGGGLGSRLSGPSTSSSPTPPPIPSRAGSDRPVPIDIAVIAEGRVLDAVQVTALDRGHAPKMQSKLRKAAGVTVGLDRGRRNPYTR